MKRTEQEYDWMEGSKNSTNKKSQSLSPFFLRKPYSGTSAETSIDKRIEEEKKDNEQDSV
jgi:hypothetical protein